MKFDFLWEIGALQRCNVENKPSASDFATITSCKCSSNSTGRELRPPPPPPRGPSGSSFLLLLLHLIFLQKEKMKNAPLPFSVTTKETITRRFLFLEAFGFYLPPKRRRRTVKSPVAKFPSFYLPFYICRKSLRKSLQRCNWIIRMCPEIGAVPHDSISSQWKFNGRH